MFKNNIVRFLFISSFIIYSLFLVIQYYPNYQLFYNRLVGGPGNAQKYNLVELCSGTTGALEFINQNYSLDEPVAIIGCSKVIAPYYSPRKITTDWKNTKLVIIEDAYRQLMSESDVIKFFDHQKPKFIVNEKGAILSRVYFQQIN